ncbi:MAG TPA: HIT family protein [Bacteroidia bacterium]|jgi:histidine triad (HIT) family protein|nr:HIT family protein [Bacteroidia bacterium]
MPSIFSKIIAGDIPCYKIAENEHCIAFLDINPLSEGHALVVPKKEVDYLFDLDNEAYLQLMQFCKQVAIAIKKAVSCKRITSVVLGFEVPHAHIHLIPAHNEKEVNFSNPKIKFSKDEFESTAKKIALSFNEL